ncbi:MAG: hypothetical protein ACYTGX_05860 [Planctomycetota bacterium]|jgi:hypothetical protein
MSPGSLGNRGPEKVPLRGIARAVGSACVITSMAMAMALALAATAGGCGKKGTPVQPTRVAVPKLATAAPINAPERCAACHATQVAAWRAGGHSRSLRPATADTVGMPVPGTMEAPGQYGVTVRADGGRMLMACLDKDGMVRDFPVTHVIGGTKLEMYVTTYGEDAHPQVLPAMYSNRESQFLPYWAIDLKREPKPVAHTSDRFWTQRQRTFVTYCHRCHSPLRPRSGALHRRLALTRPRRRAVRGVPRRRNAARHRSGARLGGAGAPLLQSAAGSARHRGGRGMRLVPRER